MGKVKDINVVTNYYHLLLLTTTYYLQCIRKKRRHRRYSVAPVNRLRKEQGLFNNFIRFVYYNDPERFFKYTKMTRFQFDTLLELVKPYLCRRATVRTIEPAHRLLITLHYLSEGCSMLEIAMGHRIGHATVSKIIKETTKIIWEVLNPIYLKPPSLEDWKKISNGFFNKWNMPNNLGAVDGKHIHIQAPKFGGSSFFNYKKSHSIVLMAACDAFYRFTLVDIGAAGSNHDSVVFRESGFGNNILKNKMDLPADKILPNTNVAIPFFFTADQAFPLHDRIMRPYPGRQLTQDKRIFNYRLSRGRRTIENAFGILVQRWRILRTTIIADIETCENIALATVVLHNYLQRAEEEIPLAQRKYCPTGFTDSNEINREMSNSDNDNFRLPSVRRLGANNSATGVKENRNILCQYLNSDAGSVPWQVQTIMRGSVPTNIVNENTL